MNELTTFPLFSDYSTLSFMNPDYDFGTGSAKFMSIGE